MLRQIKVTTNQEEDYRRVRVSFERAFRANAPDGSQDFYSGVMNEQAREFAYSRRIRERFSLSYKTLLKIIGDVALQCDIPRATLVKVLRSQTDQEGTPTRDFDVTADQIIWAVVDCDTLCEAVVTIARSKFRIPPSAIRGILRKTRLN